jgi:hypothetical protein
VNAKLQGLDKNLLATYKPPNITFECAANFKLLGEKSATCVNGTITPNTQQCENIKGICQSKCYEKLNF